MITKDDAAARVANGAAYLDVQRPGWFHQIDVGTLTLHDPCGCIVGQLCGGLTYKTFYPRAARDFRLNDDTTVAYGFDVRSNDYVYDEQIAFGLLQDAWIAAIADRKIAALGEPERGLRGDPVVTDALIGVRA